MIETPMLFPITPSEFWKQMRSAKEEVVAEKLSKQNLSPSPSLLPKKALFKPAEVFQNVQVSKPTLYDWLKQKE